MTARWAAVCAAAVVLWAGAAEARTHRRPTHYRFQATAFSDPGTTKSGTEAHVGIVAADPAILPMGTRIRVTGAGPYSGVYLVTDTGAKIDGHEIDIYIPHPAAAKRFGKKRVRVTVLKWGEGPEDAREAERR